MVYNNMYSPHFLAGEFGVLLGVVDGRLRAQRDRRQHLLHVRLVRQRQEPALHVHQGCAYARLQDVLQNYTS